MFKVTFRGEVRGLFVSESLADEYIRMVVSLYGMDDDSEFAVVIVPR